MLLREIPFKVPDAFRSQYYLNSMEVISKPLFLFLSQTSLKTVYQSLLAPFFCSISKECDQILLPIIEHEVLIAKRSGALEGETSKKRYENFFIKDSAFTSLAQSVVFRYPPIFKMVDSLIKSTVNSCKSCLVHLMDDQGHLANNGFIEKKDSLELVNILNGSDPHLNQRSMVLTFKSGKKVIHKPIDISPESLHSEFIEMLGLPYPYDLKTLKVFKRDKSYGWIKWEKHHACNRKSQIKNFYRRAGVQLAIADCLNYTDGHFENLIASGEYPILIDCECLFQNYSVPERRSDQKKNLLSTMLVQKPPTNRLHRGYSAALQAPPNFHHEVVLPFTLSDQTDELAVRYAGISQEKSHHCPLVQDHYFTIQDFIQEVIDGFSFGFDRILAKKEEILSNTDWWAKVGCVKSRTVIRDTLAYVYLLRRIQRPEACINETTMKDVLKSKLKDSKYTSYEIAELMSAMVPYFYHIPKEKHFYQGDGTRYHETFKKTGIEGLKEQLKCWDEKYKRFAIKILERHLALTPKKGESVYCN